MSELYVPRGRVKENGTCVLSRWVQFGAHRVPLEPTLCARFLIYAPLACLPENPGGVNEELHDKFTKLDHIRVQSSAL